MGTADRIIRILVAIGIITLYFAGMITGTLGIVLLIIATAFIITGFVGICPLYMPLGLSTLNKKGTEKV